MGLQIDGVIRKGGKERAQLGVRMSGIVHPGLFILEHRCIFNPIKPKVAVI